MHPQVIIVDGSDSENDFFLESMRKKTYAIERPLVELPHAPLKHLAWITKLDSSSLAGKLLAPIVLQQHEPGLTLVFNVQHGTRLKWTL